MTTDVQDVQAKVKGTASLKERIRVKVAEKLVMANEGLSDLNTEKAPTKAQAVKAWLYAMHHGFEKYRPTLKVAGIVKPNGNMQRAYRIAKWVRATEQDSKVDALVRETSIRDLDEQAKEGGARRHKRHSQTAGTQGQPRPTLQVMGSAVHSGLARETRPSAENGVYVAYAP